jgi:hypothetical protein
MKNFARLSAVLLLMLCVEIGAKAATVVIEPDHYAEGAVLNDVKTQVQLRIFDGYIRKNFPVDFGVFPSPSVIPVTANENEDIFGGYFTSTGTKSFGAANITFHSESNQLAMKFLVPTSRVSIDFISTSHFDPSFGVLEIYSSAGALLNSFTSTGLFEHQKATLSLFRSAGDIGYARAYSSPSGDPFGALDYLRFETITPLAGDYNRDQVVNAADYTVWRNSAGQTGAGLPADGTGAGGVPDGIVNQLDYAYWKSLYGNTSGTGSGDEWKEGIGAAVPEPSSFAIAITWTAVAFLIMGRVRTQR